MMRYRARIAQGQTLQDAIEQIEVCNGQDIVPADDEKSVTFSADIDDLTSIENMRAVGQVHRIDDTQDDGRGMYIKLMG